MTVYGNIKATDLSPGFEIRTVTATMVTFRINDRRHRFFLRTMLSNDLAVPVYVEVQAANSIPYVVGQYQLRELADVRRQSHEILDKVAERLQVKEGVTAMISTNAEECERIEDFVRDAYAWQHMTSGT